VDYLVPQTLSLMNINVSFLCTAVIGIDTVNAEAGGVLLAVRSQMSNGANFK